MKYHDMPAFVYLIGQHDPQTKDMRPLFFDLPDKTIAIPIWESKILAYTWLEGTFLQADYQIVETRRDHFVPKLIGTQCSCLIYNPKPGESRFEPDSIFELRTQTIELPPQSQQD